MAKHCLLSLGSSTSRYELLHSLLIDNIEHFGKNNSKINGKFVEIFSQFLTHLNDVEIEVNSLVNVVHLYDLDVNTPGNGYRSIIAVVDTFTALSTKLCREVISKRRNFTFSKNHYYDEVKAYVRVLSGLLAVVHIAQTLRGGNEPGALFSNYDAAFLHRILTEMENIDRTCFYEKLIAFQIDESLQKSLRFICLVATSFSHVYYASGGKFARLASALVNFCRYSHDPSKLSKRFVKVIRNSSVDFCKTLWNLQGIGFLDKLSRAVTDPLSVNRRMKLLPEPLQLIKEDGTPVDIPIPSSHTPVSSVQCRLVCAHVREGQLEGSEGSRQHPGAVKPASPYLIIHFHGSGFISVSSTIHKVYLNEWAIRLDAPILTIYHSLAPEAPYPRPLEDSFYAYAWAIKNCHLLGSTGEKICLAGCSAGGDLITCITMKAIQLGIRKPDGVLAVCPTSMTHFLPSPSDLLLLIDPLTPLEFGLACLEGYTQDPQEPEGMFVKRSLDEGKRLCARVVEMNRRAGTDDPLKSPFLVSDDILLQFPPIRFVSTHQDAVLDHLVMFLKRMKALGKDVRLDLMGNLPHGFLNFVLMSQPAHESSMLCIQRIKELLQMP